MILSGSAEGQATDFDELTAAMTAEEEAKAQKALAVQSREQEQNKLRIRQVREAQRAIWTTGK